MSQNQIILMQLLVVKTELDRTVILDGLRCKDCAIFCGMFKIIVTFRKLSNPTKTTVQIVTKVEKYDGRFHGAKAT